MSFDKSSDFYGALVGVMLNRSGLSNICNTLQRPFNYAFPGTLFDRISEFNTFYWLKSFNKTDVFGNGRRTQASTRSLLSSCDLRRP